MIFKEPLVCKKPIYQVNAGLKKPVKVALAGDWHLSRIVTAKQRQFLKQKLTKIKPDVIILQGDLIDTARSFLDAEILAELKKSLGVCTKIAPTVMVLGNHDQMVVGRGGAKTHAEYLSLVFPDVISEWRRVCRETGVKLLIDNWFEVNGLRIFGFYQDPEMYYRKPGGERTESFALMRKKIRQLANEGALDFKEGKAHWFAAHAPVNDLYRMKELGGFVAFSFGHTHGGCVPLGIDTIDDALGWHGGLISPMKKILPGRFMRGREIMKNGASYIVNSGMVATQECAPKFLQYFNWLKAAEVTEVIVK